MGESAFNGLETLTGELDRSTGLEHWSTGMELAYSDLVSKGRREV